MANMNHSFNAPINLHIGGQQAKEGWKILDAQAGPDVDFVGDIRNLEAFADGSCALVYCSHVLEHLPGHEVLPTLKEIHRILQPGGKLYLSVPDLDVLCHLFIQPRLEATQKLHVMKIIFGGQIDEYDYHKTGLTVDFLAEYLKEAGFYSLDQVENFGLFDDASSCIIFGVPISLNLIAEKWGPPGSR